MAPAALDRNASSGNWLPPCLAPVVFNLPRPSLFLGHALLIFPTYLGLVAPNEYKKNKHRLCVCTSALNWAELSITVQGSQNGMSPHELVLNPPESSEQFDASVCFRPPTPHTQSGDNSFQLTIAQLRRSALGIPERNARWCRRCLTPM